MEASCSSETSVDFQRSIRRYIPEDRRTLQFHDCIQVRLLFTHVHAHALMVRSPIHIWIRFIVIYGKTEKIYLSDLITWRMHGKFRHDSGTFVLLVSSILTSCFSFIFTYLDITYMHRCLELCTPGRWHYGGFVQVLRGLFHCVTFMLSGAVRKKHLFFISWCGILFSILYCYLFARVLGVELMVAQQDK
jgi:hypothetical protein